MGRMSWIVDVVSPYLRETSNIAVALVTPFDVVKTRLQAQDARIVQMKHSTTMIKICTYNTNYVCSCSW